MVIHLLAAHARQRRNGSITPNTREDNILFGALIAALVIFICVVIGFSIYNRV